MLKNISRFQVITQDIMGKTHEQLAEEICVAGTDWLQLRIKNAPVEIVKQTASSIRKICDKYGASFILNDLPELAKEVNADGVHLGKEDMSILSARKLLGDKIIIGGSTNNYHDIVKGVDAGADYLGLGPFRFTLTKSNLNPVLGISGFERIMNEYHRVNFKIPIIAIGGITVEDVEPLLQLGVYGFAVSSAINFSNNKKVAVNNFLSVINHSRVTIP